MFNSATSGYSLADIAAATGKNNNDGFLSLIHISEPTRQEVEKQQLLELLMDIF